MKIVLHGGVFKSLFVFLILCSTFILGVDGAHAANNTTAADMTPSVSTSIYPFGSKVMVVRDITNKAHCREIMSGVAHACATGALVSANYFVSVKEATAKGEEYVAFTGDVGKDNAATQSLWARSIAKFAKSHPAPRQIRPMYRQCASNLTTSYSFDAVGFDGTPPVIGVTVHYSHGLNGADCNNTWVHSSYTWIKTNGTTGACLDYTLYPVNSSNQFSPGCAGLPHTSSYPSPLEGYPSSSNWQDYTFRDSVASGPNFWDHHVYSDYPVQ